MKPSSNDYIFDILAKLLTSNELVGGLINFLESFDDYEQRKDEKNADQHLIKSAYILYQQGKISKDDLLKIVDVICSEKSVNADIESLLDTIRNR
jgi:hypothetical protein